MRRTDYHLEANNYDGQAKKIKSTLEETKSEMNTVDEILSEKQFKSSKDFVTSNLVSRNGALKLDIDKIIQKLNGISEEVKSCANDIDRRNEELNRQEQELLKKQQQDSNEENVE